MYPLLKTSCILQCTWIEFLVLLFSCRFKWLKCIILPSLPRQCSWHRPRPDIIWHMPRTNYVVWASSASVLGGDDDYQYDSTLAPSTGRGWRHKNILELEINIYVTTESRTLFDLVRGFQESQQNVVSFIVLWLANVYHFCLLNMWGRQYTGGMWPLFYPNICNQTSHPHTLSYIHSLQ